MVKLRFSTSDISKPQVLSKIESLCVRLQNRQLVGSHAVALETIRLFQEIIVGARFDSFEQLSRHLVHVSELLSQVAPREYVIGNMAKRVVILLQEEYACALTSHLASRDKDNHPSRTRTPSVDHDAGTSLGSLVTKTRVSKSSTQAPDETESGDNRVDVERDFDSKSLSLKPIFIEAVQELYDELELVTEGVATQAPEHIHPGELIITLDNSRTVKSFLHSAAKNKRSFVVLVSETAPSFSGRILAKALGSLTPPISNHVVSDASTFALMPKCTKLVIGCHIVFADGSILARSGTLSLALAAKAHLVPVVVVCGMFKFTAVQPAAGTDLSLLDLQTPDQVLNIAHIEDLGDIGPSDRRGEVEVLNPFYDRVPGNLISLFITNVGCHPPCTIARLLKDLYGEA